MGIWEWVFSAADVIKQKTPDVTPVKDICHNTYTYCRDSTTAVARDAHVYFSDDEVRANVGRLAKNGAVYIARSYGGGPIIDIVSKSAQENKVDSYKKRINDLEAKVAKLEEELRSKKTLDQSQISRAIAMQESQEEMDLRLVDVVNVFMKEQFVGTKLVKDLMIPSTAGNEKKEKFSV